MRFSDTNYQFSHGKKPRGFGQWAFDFHTANGRSTTEFCPYACNYSDAKRWAKQFSKTLEYAVTEIHVGS